MNYRISTAVLALAMTMPGVAHAQAQSVPADTQQEAAPAPAEDSLATTGDIVVTAQKRTERLQDVPLAVTAITGDALESRQINDTQSLVQAVPSLTFQQGTNPSNTSFRVRGIGTQLFSQGVEAAVAVVVDGVVAARQAQGFADFADLERIEVLRGPQGTLFGRNATAGVLNITTARPSSTFEARGDVTIAEQNEYRAKGTVSGPLTDTLRARLTGFYNNVGGITYNYATDRMVNGSESWGVRGKLDWDATSNLNFLLSVDHRDTKADCCAQVLISAVNPVIAQLTAPVVASRRNRAINDETLTYGNSRQTTASLQADWDLGPATVTSITAYQDYRLDANQSVDRIPSLPVRFVSPTFAYAHWPLGGGSVQLGNITQELRIASNGGGDLSYVAGVFYSDLNIDRDFTRRRATCSAGVIGQPCATTPVYQSARSDAHLDGESIAAFGQVDYRIVGGLKALGGLRIQRETVGVRGTRVSPVASGETIFPGSGPVSGSRRTRDTALTGKAGLQYEFSRNAQLYGSYTRGYKGPGFDTEITANFATQDPIQPEHVNAYEIGFKGQTADRSLSFSAALFLSDYSNLQVQANRSDPATGVTQFVTTNAGSSQTKGFEIEAVMRPTRAFTVNASLTYAEATADIDGLNCPLQFQGAAPILTGGFPVNSCYRRRTVVGGTTVTSGPLQDVRGGTLPASPRYRINITPRYEDQIPGTSLTGFVQTAINFQSAQNFSLEQDPLLAQPSYTLVDLAFGVRTEDSRYSLTLFVKNLFDTNYLTSIAHNSLLATTGTPFDLIANYNKDADRYAGMTLGVRF
ncbi:TonB-dependent receptor [Sphingomonas pseudosanguinis]|uniref:Iron complex outermembrane receptor protein n=1 Tax=Sphingomonas pseudosanguinis TaxID=413712 RepID=A0A7W6AA44_9SPHN|nr:TonB-dependent receptor [Sphingomonas pseudosanguinis]MBB3878870.1 iron complex outermembrane receptor protein [Sphingomonas pseudosanguinis]